MVKVETENLLPVFVMLSLNGLKAALIASSAIYNNVWRIYDKVYNINSVYWPVVNDGVGKLIGILASFNVYIWILLH